ncbi:MAG: XRE family transcriptional regulator, partial [Chitinophagaceae bacterium]
MTLDLKTYRLLKGLSQEAMAKELNLAKSTISMIENNERKFPTQARAIFESLLAAEPALADAPLPQVPFGLEEVKGSNLALTETALIQLERECNFDLLRQERKLRNWKHQYEKAMAAYMLAKDLLAKMEKNNSGSAMPAGYAANQQMAKVKALQKLTHIGDQKPVLTIVKI